MIADWNDFVLTHYPIVKETPYLAEKIGDHSMKKLKEQICTELIQFVEEEEKERNQKRWKQPLIEFADAYHPYVRRLKEIVHSEHQMPEEVLKDAKTVLVYFLPFCDWVAKSNEEEGLASSEWARIYEETNAFFLKINQHMIKYIEGLGYQARMAPEASVFYRDEVISHWSFRHLAYAAGLGTFGMNNMLITEYGCAGRLNALVTNLPVETGSPQKEEACLYKRNGSCGLCIKRCPSQALTDKKFDRHKCFAQCLKNAEVHTQFGNSYADQAGEEAVDSGSEVCGKCLVHLPCTSRRP